MLRFGPANGPVVLVASALFEEANRTRAFTVAILRGLADHQIAGALPDLPGTGESPIDTPDATLDDWRTAFAAAASSLGGRPVFVVALRGGALVTTAANVAGRYHIAPIDGATVVRDLARVRMAAAKEAGQTFDRDDIELPGPPIEFGGNILSREQLATLSLATIPITDRIARLATDPTPADFKPEGRPLWRASEPDVDPALSASLIVDIADWVHRCAG